MEEGWKRWVAPATSVTFISSQASTRMRCALIAHQGLVPLTSIKLLLRIVSLSFSSHFY